jgi:putative flippase GtrA
MQSDFVESSASEGDASLAVTASQTGPQPYLRPVEAVAGWIVEQLISRQTLIRYAIIGASGYVVYLAILATTYDLGLLPFLPAKDAAVDLGPFTHGDARLLITTLLATQASIITVFIGHCRWTFAETAVRPKPLWLRFVQFEARALISTLGILTVTVNIAVLSGINHFLAVPIGFVATFTWNWLWDSRFIWKGRREV